MSEVYKNSLSLMKRNTNILYYDCTNFFFEIENPNGIRQYGVSKENRPNPIVQLGLFMDADGIPLAFCVNSGNTNEQTTLDLHEKFGFRSDTEIVTRNAMKKIFYDTRNPKHCALQD